ncbi:MAG: hypothetical protein M1834_008354 [Cirrosporium novae-zelandiae]|nr:MAG: hypothetical protein M1834_008354 [Cirrosporium novae-zelandiae]
MEGSNRMKYALRCSREIPKCNNCKAWPGPCVYSKQAPLSRRTASSAPQPSKSELDIPQQSTETRLARIESSLDSLTSAVHELGELLKWSRPRPLTNSQAQENERRDLTREDDQSAYHPECIPSPSFLTQTSNDIGSLLASIHDVSHSNAAAELSSLSLTFSSAGYSENKITRALRDIKKKREAELYFVPKPIDGVNFIKIFTEKINIGSPFMSSPPDEILPNIVFEPWTVAERGWVAMFNCIISSHASSQSPPDQNLLAGLRLNMLLALDDAAFFIEPNEIRIQALILLAVHGREFSTPMLCWTLVGHACRMAQAISLHIPSGRRPETFKSRMCLLWGLITIDSSLSFAFGRPAYLPPSTYEHLPFPTAADFQGFSPHNPKQDGDANSFGAVFTAQFFTLSRITCKISAVVLNHPKHTDLTPEIEAEWFSCLGALEAWFTETTHLLQFSITQMNVSNIPENSEITLGLNVLKFQYHHLKVVLYRTGPSQQKAHSLDSAREAIKLLSKLVSTTEQVYNGLVWQLLYYPFTPFFVLFGKIVSNPHLPDTAQDLGLLQDAVRYFVDMRDNYPDAVKLEQVASSFARLAEKQVLRSTEASNQCCSPSRSQNELSGHAITSLRDSLTFDFGDIVTDTSLLDFFTWPIFQPSVQTDTIMSETFDIPQQSMTNTNQVPDGQLWDRPWDYGFDWLSWDLSAQQGNGSGGNG